MAHLLGLLEQVLIVVLPKVQNGVTEVASTTGALSAGLVLLAVVGSPHTVVSQLSQAAVFADFEVGVAVQLGNLALGNSTLQVESINILRYHMLANIPAAQLSDGHVSWSWHGALYGCVEPRLWDGLGLEGAILPRLLDVGQLLPATRSGLQHGVGTASVIGNTSRCGQTSSCKDLK